VAVLARILLFVRCTFPGRRCARRAEIERQGFDRVPGKEAKTAPFGVPSPFAEL
jgi:hypothetical protein